MEPGELKDRVAEIRWYHRMDLGSSVVTPGPDRTARKLKTLGLPKNLSGWTVLDVGARDGFFAFEAERRGATEVLAVDKPSWTHRNSGRKGFDLAREVFRSNVKDKEILAEDLSPAAVGTFDLVLFLGVLYHLKNPLLALERVASVTKKQLIVETATDMLSTRRPAAAFYPGTELVGDPSNWWGPNPDCVLGMLKTVGFREVRLHYASSRVGRMGRTVYRSLQKQGSLRVGLNQGRAVFHAFH